jgi:hypothetical protein
MLLSFWVTDAPLFNNNVLLLLNWLVSMAFFVRPLILERYDRQRPQPRPLADALRGRLPEPVVIPNGLDIWVRHAINEEWTAAFRLVWSGGRVRVGEARIFPTEPDGDGRNGGAWSGCWWGIDAAAPRRGLTKRVLSLAQPHRWLQSAEKVNQEFRRAFPKGVQLPKAVGQRAPRSKTGRRGRPGHTDEFLAQIADEYVRALKKGRFPVKTVAAQHEAKEAKVRGPPRGTKATTEYED